MCGIFGLFSLDGKKADLNIALTGAKFLNHRGPDGSGSFHEGCIAIAHTRLAIQDLSSSAVQPMKSMCGRYIISYNGEIYNTKEISDNLVLAGKQMRTNSDTELFLEAWAKWGAKALLKIEGMFAVAIWDRKEKSLTLIRDPIGIKPLFLYQSKNTLYFSSEVQALLKATPVEKRLNQDSLTDMLFLGGDIDPTTSIKDISSLEPGNYLTIDTKGISKKTTYWSLALNNIKPSDVTKFENILENNIALSMTSDVPVDILLSAGIDSNVIATAIKQQRQSVNCAHIMKLSGRNFDESSMANSAANYLNISSKICDIRDINLVELSDQVLIHSGEITPNPSFIATWHLLKNVAPAKVVLSGDGPDELLYGYDTYDASYIASCLNFLSEKKLWHQMAHNLLNFGSSFDRRTLYDSLARFLYGLGFNQNVRHGIWRYLMSAHDAKLLLLSSEIADNIGKAVPAELAYGNFNSLLNSIRNIKDPFKKLSYADLSIYLPNDGLVKMDRVGMAHGVEVRVPYLNKSFVEYCLGLPTKFSYRPFLHRKSPLKHYLKKYGYAELLKVKKRGFNVPIGDWMLTKSMSEYCSYWLSSEVCKKHGLFQTDYVDHCWRQHKTLKQNYANILWPVIATHRFLDHYKVSI